MKVIRWFLSHIILILLVVAVIYGYMFWGNLLGEKTPAGKAIAYLSGEFTVVAEFVEAVKEKQAQLSSDREASEQVDESVASSDRSPATISPVPAVSVQPVPVQPIPVQSRPVQPMPVQSMPKQPMPDQQRASVPAYTQPEPAPQPEPMSMSNRQGNENPSGLQSSADTGSSSSSPDSSPSISDGVAGALVPSAPKRSDVFISAKVEKRLDNVDESGKVIDSSLQAVDARSSWIAARKAYYQRNYDVSEQSYQDVIDNTQDNFDAYGELGNVYFNQGKNKQAAAAYFSAASIMINKGQVNRARGLLGLLRHLDKDKAEELQKLITSATSSPS